MHGTIGLKNLRVDCVVGIYDFERTGEQPLFVDVEVDAPFDPAADSEHVDSTVDYDHLAKLLTDLAVERRYQLIETFARDALDAILERWASVAAARIEIRKPQAVPAADASFVRASRTR